MSFVRRPGVVSFLSGGMLLLLALVHVFVPPLRDTVLAAEDCYVGVALLAASALINLFCREPRRG